MVHDRPGHSGTFSDIYTIHSGIGFFYLKKWSYSGIIKNRVGFESDPPGSGWVRVLSEVAKLFDSIQVFYIQLLKLIQIT